jgi:hypothetical protein
LATTAVAQQRRPCTEGPVVAFAYIRAKPGMFDKWNTWTSPKEKAHGCSPWALLLLGSNQDSL